MGGLVAHPVRAYLGFFGWKRLRVYQLPLWVDSRSVAFPVSSLAWYFFVLLDGGTVRHRGTVRVKCPVEEHNRSIWLRFEPRPLDPLTPFLDRGGWAKIGDCQENGSLIPTNFRSHVFFHSFFIDHEPWTDYRKPGESGKILILSALFLSFFVLFVAILLAVTGWKIKINQMENRWTRRRYVGVYLQSNLYRL